MEMAGGTSPPAIVLILSDVRAAAVLEFAVAPMCHQARVAKRSAAVWPVRALPLEQDRCFDRPAGR